MHELVKFNSERSFFDSLHVASAWVTSTICHEGFVIVIRGLVFGHWHSSAWVLFDAVAMRAIMLQAQDSLCMFLFLSSLPCRFSAHTSSLAFNLGCCMFAYWSYYLTWAIAKVPQ